MKAKHYKKAGFGSTPSVKPSFGDCGGPGKTTMASNAGNSGRSIKSGPFKKNPRQKPGQRRSV